jgi:hypothetical protein
MEYEYSLPNTVQMTATVVAMQQNFYQQCRYVLYDDAMIHDSFEASCFYCCFFQCALHCFLSTPEHPGSLRYLKSSADMTVDERWGGVHFLQLRASYRPHDSVD